MAFDGTEGGQISLTDAAKMTAQYRKNNPNQKMACFFGRDILLELLNQENCMGIRMYYGESEDGESELVLVGANAYENDILDLVVDFSSPCPPVCSSSNPLNS